MSATALMSVLYGVAVFAVVNAGVVYASYAFATRLVPAHEIRARLLATGVLCVALIVLIAQALSPSALFTREAVLVIAAAAGLAAWLAGGPRLAPKADLRAVARAFVAAASSQGAIVLVLALIGLLFAVQRAAQIPPLAWDSVTYHLAFAARFVQTGSLVTMNGPFAMDRYDHFPKNGETVAAWMMLPFHGDLFVGFMNVTFVVFGWLATYTVGREIGLDRRDAALAATATCTSPFLYAFITTQNPDVLVFAVLTSAIVFALRYSSDGPVQDAWLACTAAGIAVGAKYTAVPMAAMVLGALALTAFTRRIEAGTTGRWVSGVLVGVAIVTALGSRQYVVNAISVGNPLYPMTVGSQLGVLSRGSPFTEQQVEETGRGSRWDDLIQFIQTFNYKPNQQPTTAGPKYLLLGALALLAMLHPRSDRRVRWLMVAALVGLAFAYAPGSGFAAVSRRFWPASTPRFLAVYFGVISVVGFWALRRMSDVSAAAVRLIVIGFIVWDLQLANSWVPASFPLVAGLGGLALVGALALGSRRFGIAAGWIALAAVPFIVALDAYRSVRRWDHYAASLDVHALPREYVKGWRALDRPDAPQTIALTAGWADRGENWFYFPLMGRRLQNTVTYVPIEPNAPPASRTFVRREEGDPAAWVQALSARQVTVVFEQAPWPVEDEWMRARPDVFRLVEDGRAYRIFAVTPSGSMPVTGQ